MRRLRCGFPFARAGVLLLGLASVAALAGELERPFPLLDRGHGEEREIAARVEWFRRTRGLDEAPQARELRARATGALGRALARGTPALLANQAWQPLGPESMTMLDWRMGNVAGRVSALAVDPADENILYLGAAAGGLWKSSDGGQQWQQLFDAIGTQSIGSILVEAGNDQHVWVGTGEADAGCLDYFGMGLFYSADGGQTFEARNGSGDATLTLSFVTALAQSPLDPQVLLAGGKGQCNQNGGSSGGGIYRSADGGQTWSSVYAASAVRDLLFTPDGSAVYASVRAKGIFKSIDAGLTWTVLANGLPQNSGAANARLAMAPSDPSTLYALIGSNSSGDLQLYRSSDAGDSWTQVNPSACEGQCSYNLTVDVSPTDPGTVLVGTIRPALSTDGGATLDILTAGWSWQQSVHQDTHIVRFSHSDPNRFWIGSDGGLWRSDDGGGTFANLNAGLEITQFYDIALDPTDPSRIFGGAQDNSSSRRDGSLVWDVTEVTGDGFMNAVDATSPNRVFQTSYPNGGAMVILSTDGGTPNSYQWVNQSGMVGSEPFQWVTPLVTAAGSVFVASDHVYRAPIGDDAGAYAWTPVSDALVGAVSVLAPAPQADPAAGSLRMYAGTSSGHVAVCEDVLADAPVWTDISGTLPHGNIADIAIDAVDETRVFLVRSAFAAPHLFRWNTTTSDWDVIGDGLPGVPANSVAIDPADGNRLFVGTDIGVYESADGGDTFVPFMTGMPLGMVVTDLEVAADPHMLVAGTYGRGAWTIGLDPVIDDRVFADGFELPAR